MEEKMENVQVEYDIPEDADGIGEGKSSVPMGYKLYISGTIIWMLYYVWKYLPAISGWTQNVPLDQLK